MSQLPISNVLVRLEISFLIPPFLSSFLPSFLRIPSFLTSSPSSSPSDPLPSLLPLFPCFLSPSYLPPSHVPLPNSLPPLFHPLSTYIISLYPLRIPNLMEVFIKYSSRLGMKNCRTKGTNIFLSQLTIDR